MSFSVTRFGDGEEITTTVVNRPIDQIVAFLNNETGGSFSVTQYNVGDEISAEVMNAPLIEVRDHLNGLAQCSGPLSLDLYQNGEDVTSANLNRPIDQIVQFINNECSFDDDLPDLLPPTSSSIGGLYVLSSESSNSLWYVDFYNGLGGVERNQGFTLSHSNVNSSGTVSGGTEVLRIKRDPAQEQSVGDGTRYDHYVLGSTKSDIGYTGSVNFQSVMTPVSITADHSAVYLLCPFRVSSYDNFNARHNYNNYRYGVIKISSSNQTIQWIRILDNQGLLYHQPGYTSSLGTIPTGMSPFTTTGQYTDEFRTGAYRDGGLYVDPDSGDIAVVTRTGASRLSASNGQILWEISSPVVTSDDTEEKDLMLGSSAGKGLARVRGGAYWHPPEESSYEIDSGFEIYGSFCESLPVLNGFTVVENRVKVHDGRMYFIAGSPSGGNQMIRLSFANGNFQTSYNLDSSFVGRWEVVGQDTFILGSRSQQRLFRYFRGSITNLFSIEDLVFPSRGVDFTAGFIGIERHDGIVYVGFEFRDSSSGEKIRSFALVYDDSQRSSNPFIKSSNIFDSSDGVFVVNIANTGLHPMDVSGLGVSVIRSLPDGIVNLSKFE